MTFNNSENVSANSFTIPSSLLIQSWADVEPYFEFLVQFKFAEIETLNHWLKLRSDLEALLQEDMGWRYIRFTCDTENEKFKKELDVFIEEIEPKIAFYQNKLNVILEQSGLIEELEKDQEYKIYIRNFKTEMKLFREESLDLIAEVQSLSNDYGKISSAFMVQIDGDDYTFNQAANFLKSTDRAKRKQVYEAIVNRRLAEKDNFNQLFDDLLQKRHQIAKQAGYENYRDYMFDALFRFDYSPSDAKVFHQSIKEIIVPICQTFDQKRKDTLGCEAIKPYDLEVDLSGGSNITPYKDGQDLISKTIDCFARVKPRYAQYIEKMNEMGHLDLDSRKGKAPGGYNYPLYKSGVPFIFMNSASSVRDMATMIHEGGHAIHSFLSQPLKITAFKNFPSEIAELASMSMELITLDYWDTFIKDTEELKRAKRYHLEKTISILPWIAAVDSFQHWIYENPNHTQDERETEWVKIIKSFNGEVVDWSNYPEVQANLWHKQLHIFEVPFYYIEYAIAQLGAIAVWKNYKQNPESALKAFEKALSAGNTLTLPELYALSGIKFSFERSYIDELMQFILKELNEIV